MLVYYAGHGCNDKEADKVYWLPVDAQSDDTARWVSADDITTSIRVFPARHVLIVPDSCKYLNNVIEQDHRFVKKKVRASQCFKSFHTAERTLESIEAIT